jgi:hypothetical protein
LSLYSFRWSRIPLAPVAFAAGWQEGFEVTRYLNRANPLAGVLVLILGLTLASPPAFAAEAQATAPAQPLAAAAAAKVEAMPAAVLAQAAQAAPTPAAPTTGGKPFLKSTKGIIAVALMVTGVTWAAISRSQDAVHSPARK